MNGGRTRFVAQIYNLPYRGFAIRWRRGGECALVHGARIICDAEVLIGDHALISWNVVLMDTYRVPSDATGRRKELELVPTRQPRLACADVSARPIRIERNVWIGFDAVVL